MHVAVCTVLNSWWLTETPSQTCTASFQNKINLIHWSIWLVLLQKYNNGFLWKYEGESGPISIGLSHVWIKKILRWWRFAGDDEVTNAVHTWVRSRQKTFFADEVRRLVKSYKMCVEKRNDYVEEWCTSNLSQTVVHKVTYEFTFVFDNTWQ